MFANEMAAAVNFSGCGMFYGFYFRPGLGLDPSKTAAAKMYAVFTVYAAHRLDSSTGTDQVFFAGVIADLCGKTFIDKDDAAIALL
jgi:hypothetical protein